MVFEFQNLYTYLCSKLGEVWINLHVFRMFGNYSNTFVKKCGEIMLVMGSLVLFLHSNARVERDYAALATAVNVA